MNRLKARPRRAYSLKAKLCLSCGSLLITLFVVEVGARVFARLAVKQRVITCDETLGWKLIPHARKLYSSDEVPFLIEINSKGLRDKEYAYEKPPDVFRLVVVGDSFTFGSGGVDHEETFTEILESALESVEVINLGVPGYSMGQEYLYLKQEGLKYHPDLVMLCMCENDYVPTFKPYVPSIERPKGYFRMHGGELVFHPPEFSWLDRAGQGSYLLGFLEREFKVLRRMYASAATQRLEMTADEQAEVIERLLISMRKACLERSADFTVVNIPPRDRLQDTAVQRVAAKLAASGEVDFLDLANTEPFRELEARRLLYFEQDIHLNPMGHDAAAKLLQNYISNRRDAQNRARSVLR